MKYFSVLCILIIFALAACYAAVVEPEAAAESAVAEKKTEKRGIYGFGYGHGGYGGFGGYGGYYGGHGGHGGYYGGHGGLGYPGYGYASVHHAVPYYGGHGGFGYPYHGHGFYH